MNNNISLETFHTGDRVTYHNSHGTIKDVIELKNKKYYKLHLDSKPESELDLVLASPYLRLDVEYAASSCASDTDMDSDNDSNGEKSPSKNENSSAPENLANEDDHTLSKISISDDVDDEKSKANDDIDDEKSNSNDDVDDDKSKASNDVDDDKSKASDDVDDDKSKFSDDESSVSFTTKRLSRRLHSKSNDYDNSSPVGPADVVTKFRFKPEEFGTNEPLFVTPLDSKPIPENFSVNDSCSFKSNASDNSEFLSDESSTYSSSSGGLQSVHSLTSNMEYVDEVI